MGYKFNGTHQKYHIQHPSGTVKPKTYVVIHRVQYARLFLVKHEWTWNTNSKKKKYCCEYIYLDYICEMKIGFKKLDHVWAMPVATRTAHDYEVSACP